MDSLATVNKAKQLLVSARTLDDVLKIRNMATAAEAYCMRATGAHEANLEVLGIKLRAERKAGEIIREEPKEKGGHPSLYQNGTSLSHIKQRYGNTTVNRWQRMSLIPDQQFETYLSRATKRTQTSLLRLAEKFITEPIKPVQSSESSIRIFHSDFSKLDVETESIDLVLTDPPWSKQYLKEWEKLSIYAERVLRPGGRLVD